MGGSKSVCLEVEPLNGVLNMCPGGKKQKIQVGCREDNSDEEQPLKYVKLICTCLSVVGCQ